MIKIELDKKEAMFAPAETISGTVSWSEAEGTSMEARLIWYTVGKGDQDFELVAVHEAVGFGPAGSERFEFIAPSRPLSFSGKLISLQWAIEAIIFPEKSADRVTLAISKSGQEIVLASSPASESL